MRTTVDDGRRRIAVGLAVFVTGMMPLFIRDLWGSLVCSVGAAIAVVAVVFAVSRFREYSRQLIPDRFAAGPRPSVRLATRAASGYAVYLVGFYTLIAVLVLFGAVGALF